MDYEKAYKDALERAREFQKSKDGLCVLTAESIFPELKESEDERIRKGIIDFLWKEKIFLQEAHSSVENNPKYRFVMDAIADAVEWLETTFEIMTRLHLDSEVIEKFEKDLKKKDL